MMTMEEQLRALYPGGYQGNAMVGTSPGMAGRNKARWSGAQNWTRAGSAAGAAGATGGWIDPQTGALLRTPSTAAEARDAQMAAEGWAQQEAQKNWQQATQILAPSQQTYQQGLQQLATGGGMSAAEQQDVINRGTEELSRALEASQLALGRRAAAAGGTVGAGGYAEGLRGLVSDFAGQRAGLARDVRLAASDKRQQNQALATQLAGRDVSDLAGMYARRAYQTPDLSGLWGMAGMGQAAGVYQQAMQPRPVSAPQTPAAGLASLTPASSGRYSARYLSARPWLQM